MFQECHFIFSIQEFIVFSHVDNNPSGCVKQQLKRRTLRFAFCVYVKNVITLRNSQCSGKSKSGYGRRRRCRHD